MIAITTKSSIKVKKYNLAKADRRDGKGGMQSLGKECLVIVADEASEVSAFENITNLLGK